MALPGAQPRIGRRRRHPQHRQGRQGDGVEDDDDEQVAWCLMWRREVITTPRPFALASWFVAGMLALASAYGQLAAQSEPASAMKVGILPFADATASGNMAVGSNVARTMQAEIVHSTSLVPRVLTLEGSTRADDLDGEKAVEIGRHQKVDVVFFGTVLEAKSDESSKGGF